MPADWPGQFFPRQIVYQKARQATSISTVPQGSSTHPLCCHSHFRALALDLDADDDIVLGYMPFMRLFYESLFPGKNLADKPKP